jgi:hypothetical protein
LWFKKKFWFNVGMSDTAETKIEQEITAKVDTKVKVDPKKKQKNKAKNDHGETVIDQGYCLCWKN